MNEKIHSPKEDSESIESSIHPFKEDYENPITGEKIPIEGWRYSTENLTITASREVGTNNPYSVIFHGGSGDYQELTGKGMFNAVKELKPFIEYLDKKTGGNWYASCDDRKRMHVYSRWLPPKKIKYE